MSLSEALLLDPAPFNAWIAVRTDGIKGSGTLNDPYDGGSAAKFDTLMNSMPANTCIHLGAGIFQTKGYADGVTGGWQPKAGMKLIGSGIDVTILQLTGATTANRHYFAIGHALAVEGIEGTRADFFEEKGVSSHNRQWTRCPCHFVFAPRRARACQKWSSFQLGRMDGNPPDKPQIEKEIAGLEARLVNLRKSIGQA